MILSRPILLCCIVLAVVACSDGPPAGAVDGTWVGTITTEGNVTTVVNESGSVWGGTAKLIEEASIGVDQGTDPYMFGDVRGLTASEREIYVLDAQIPTVRVYDYVGNHLRDIGQAGQGPGELQNPRAVGALELAQDGRLFVKDRGRITVLSPTGEAVETWPLPMAFSSNRPMVLTTDGTLFFHDLLERGSDVTERRHGMRAVGPTGTQKQTIPVPEFDVTPYWIVNRFDSGTVSQRVPFGPRVVWALSSSGAMIAGFPSEYRFDIHRPDGRIMRVEKAWIPVPVGHDEADWEREHVTAINRQDDPTWQWNGPPIPDNKPAYSLIDAGRSGRIWVSRIIRTEDAGDCDPDPREPAGSWPRSCWRQVYGLDLFDEETGHYLGAVKIPTELSLSALSRSRPFIKDDVFIARIEDEAGTIMVKRYRLVLPGER